MQMATEAVPASCNQDARMDTSASATAPSTRDRDRTTCADRPAQADQRDGGTGPGLSLEKGAERAIGKRSICAWPRGQAPRARAAGRGKHLREGRPRRAQAHALPRRERHRAKGPQKVRRAALAPQSGATLPLPKTPIVSPSTWHAGMLGCFATNRQTDGSRPELLPDLPTSYSIVQPP